MIILKAYQTNAIEELYAKMKKLLLKEGAFGISFKAPTGSGKTLMISESLRSIVTDITIPFELSFVWISVRMLHEQSKEKLERYLIGTNTLKSSYFEDLQDRIIGKNEILFINWESISRRNTNILIRENELDYNLNSVMRNTKDTGRKVVLIIDESHHTANTERSRELIGLISPDLTVEVSATPLNKLYDEQVTVYIADVKAEQMIKTEVSVNPEFLSLKIGNQSSNELVLQQALNKRHQLKQQFKKEGSIVNPLLLVQLPDSKGELDNSKDEIIKLLDSRFSISEENGKMAIWLSEQKSSNLANIEKSDNEIEVLVFKQAIALGWDCPRASILVIFRELKSFTFTIQTVGRIMRMPEFKYYDSPDLNKAYVFTNLENLIIESDELKDYITQNDSKRNSSIYTNTTLRSEYIKRIRERTRLSGEFVKIFQSVATEMSLKGLINETPDKIVNFIIADGKIENVDKPGEIEVGGFVSVGSTGYEINRRFNLFVWKNCNPYAPVDSSDRIKSALYTFVRDNFGIEKYTERAQKIILGIENEGHFTEAISRSKDRYQAEVVEKLNKRGEVMSLENWEIPEFISYNEKYTVFTSKKSIMQPFYIYTEASKPEKDFMKLLDNNNNVKWWFKNRENDPKYFAISYKDENEKNSSFYVDFIVQFLDGTIGLYDTKKGSTATEKEAKYKAEALQRYIRHENQLGKRLKGGIIVPVGPSGLQWKINCNEIYSEDLNDQTSWDNLAI